MTPVTVGLLGTILTMGIAYAGLWILTVWRTRHESRRVRPRFQEFLIGFVTDFFDTLGVGSFAPSTAWFRLKHVVPDELIPGTLNVGHALPTTVQAVIFIVVAQIDPVLLVVLIAAATLGAWTGAGVVVRLDRRLIQLGMGTALLVAASLFYLANLHLLPGGGDALALTGWRLAVAVVLNFVFGALMTVGVGLYGPCMIALALLGMSPVAAFPVMMGSCACLQPAASVRFLRSGRYSLPAAIGLTAGGIPAVIIAAFVVKSLPLAAVRWLVIGVVLFVAIGMLRSACSRDMAPAICSE
jgi:uncharacterized membrane protein YfcA